MKDRIDIVNFVVLCRGKEKIYLSQRERKTVEESRRALEGLIKSNPNQTYCSGR